MTMAIIQHWIIALLFMQSFSTILSIDCPNTKPGGAVPKISPRVDIGGYESVPNPILESKRDIFIYWETIELGETCDDPFQYEAFYEVITKDNKIRLVESNNTLSNHAEFYGLKTSVGYNFRVYSANKYGRSEVYTEIYVPHKTEVRFLKPLVLKKSKISNNAFELIWIYEGDYKDQLNNYTLFWCENEDESYSPHQCNGNLNWIYMDNSESHYTFTVPDPLKTYTFAISANGHSLFDIDKVQDQDVFMSGGMVWESCSYLEYMDMVLIQKIWVSDIGEHHLGLRWKFDCIDNFSLVTDYIIFYCPVLFHGDYMYCKGDLKSKFVYQNEMTLDQIPFAYINNLEPSTEYVLSIAARSVYGNIVTSVPLIASTTTGRDDTLLLLPTFIDTEY